MDNIAFYKLEIPRDLWDKFTSKIPRKIIDEKTKKYKRQNINDCIIEMIKKKVDGEWCDFDWTSTKCKNRCRRRNNSRSKEN